MTVIDAWATPLATSERTSGLRVSKSRTDEGHPSDSLSCMLGDVAVCTRLVAKVAFIPLILEK